MNKYTESLMLLIYFRFPCFLSPKLHSHLYHLGIFVTSFSTNTNSTAEVVVAAAAAAAAAAAVTTTTTTTTTAIAFFTVVGSMYIDIVQYIVDDIFSTAEKDKAV